MTFCDVLAYNNVQIRLSIMFNEKKTMPNIGSARTYYNKTAHALHMQTEWRPKR